jgi:hypothetical protein
LGEADGGGGISAVGGQVGLAGQGVGDHDLVVGLLGPSQGPVRPAGPSLGLVQPGGELSPAGADAKHLGPVGSGGLGEELLDGGQMPRDRREDDLGAEQPVRRGELRKHPAQIADHLAGREALGGAGPGELPGLIRRPQGKPKGSGGLEELPAVHPLLPGRRGDLTEGEFQGRGQPPDRVGVGDATVFDLVDGLPGRATVTVALLLGRLMHPPGDATERQAQP